MPFSPLRLLLFILALIVLIIFIQIGMISIAFDKLGLSEESAFLLLLCTLLYVTVTTVAIERMMRRAGIVIERFGPPMQIGVERTVALAIFNNDETCEALFGRYQEAA